MANKTVYPFGTGGQLPSNIGIVNDLTTGGATAALSSEMGKVLNGKASISAQQDDGLVSGTHSLVQTDGGIVNGAYSTQRKKYLIPTKGLTKIEIQTSSANAYAFLKSWDFGTNTFVYATGYTQEVDLSANQTLTVTTFPSDAAYFYIESAFVWNDSFVNRTFRKFEIDGYDALKSTATHILEAEGTLSTLNASFTAEKAISDSSQLVADTSKTLVAGETNNVFIYESYAIKKGQRIRFEMDGFGTDIEEYRYYMDGTTYFAKANPLEFIADQDHTLTRVAITSASILQSGETITFRANCIGYQQSITDIKTGLNAATKEMPVFAGLSTLQAAANVSGHVFTQSFSFDIYFSDYKQQSSIFQCASKYLTDSNYDAETADVPKIQFNSLFDYAMSNYNDITIKEWRVLQPRPSENKIHVVVTIPTGVQLIISDFTHRYSSERGKGDLMIYSHGNMGGSHFCTMEAWNRAAICGAYGVIAVPKRTSDGVWVAYHDDGNVNGAMWYDNASSIASGVTVNNSTYATTQTWRYGGAYKSAYNINADGTKTTDRIPRLEDFFKVCAKTGMHPCLSWHPYPDVIVDGHYRDFVEVKALADKYGMTGKLCIKLADSDYLPGLHDVFGDTLEMVLVNVGNSTYETLLGYLQNNGVDIFDKTKIKYGIEYSSGMDTASESVINQLVANGYIVGMCYVTDGKRMEWCLEHGITDYTLDVFHSWGLNW